MATTYRSLKRNRVYQRRFDHELAAQLHDDGGWTYKELGALFGVTLEAVRQAINPAAKARGAEYAARWRRSGVCIRCGGPCSKSNKLDRRMCRACYKIFAGEEALANRVQTKNGEVFILCSHCRLWKNETEFALKIREAAKEPFGNKRRMCRSCDTAARRDYRERNDGR